jgi:hypothetical protein
MKTILVKKYLERLSNLNDQLCYFQFTRNELNSRINNFGDNARKLYLPDIFAQNNMAPRLNVTLGKLPDFQLENQTFTFGAYIATSYEIVSYYLEDSLDLLEEFNPSTYQSNNDRQLEEKYFLTLTNSGYSLINREIIDTLKYIRLRRNHFTHLSTTLKSVFNDLIIQKGNNLNNYWKGAINSLDFSSTDVEIFYEEETIEIIKLLRIIVEELDKNLSINLSHEGIITYLSKLTYENNPQRINADVIEQRTKKILSLAKQEFGITLLNSEIKPIVKTIGIR